MERGSKVGERRRTVLAQWLRCSVACVLAVAGIAVVTLATVGVTGEAPATAAGPQGSWQVEQTYNPTPGALSALSCATASDCMAAESGDVLVTTNGGTNWTTVNAPAGIGQVDALSCPSSTTCTVVGVGAQSNLPVVAATTNGGMSWTNQNLPPGLVQLTGISCPSTTTCSAVGAWSGAADPAPGETAAVVTTTSGGATWTAESIPADNEEALGISCPSTTTCVAVGAGPYSGSCSPFPNCPVSLSFVMSTTNGGTTWSGETGSSPGSGEGDSFQSVSCPSTSECMAVGSTNGIGEQRGVADGILLSGTCTLATGCGSLSTLSTTALTSVSCFSASTCTALGGFLVGFGGLIATAGASGWTTQSAPLGALSGVTCPSASECVASGGVAEDGQPGAVAETTNGGANWAVVFSFPYAVSSLFAVSCPAPSVCDAVGGTTGPGQASGSFGPGEGPGVVLNSTDGGADWTPQVLPAATGPLSAVSCASTSVCEALGNDPYAGAPFIVGTTNGGATWQSQTAPPGVQTPLQLSCPSTSDCTGVGETSAGSTSDAEIFDTTDGGSTWTTETAPSGLTDLTSIACPSVTECTAVGQTNVSSPTPNAAIVATTDGGATWTTEAPPSGVNTLTSIACPTVSACTAIGHVTTPMSAGPLTVISTSDGGATWTTGSFPSSQVSYADDIACTSSTTCTVVGEGPASNGPGLALATTNGGSTWTTESTPTASDYAGISCPATGACTAVGVQTGASANGGALIIGQAPITSMRIPSNGATVSGSQLLDASAASPEGMGTVKFEVTGGTLSDQVVASGFPTLYGWLGQWNTTAVPNGSYMLESVATDTDGTTVTSNPVTVTVDNPPPTSTVLIPVGGASVSGSSSLLDASASANVSNVTYELSGGTLTDQVIATGTPTDYGWLAEWNTTTVPNGTYNLQTVAAYAGGVSGPSAPVSITVDNPPPSSTVLVPAEGASVSGTSSVLDASASANVSGVTYELSGGTLTDHVIATGTPTYYGWLAEWNTTLVHDGSYSLISVATYPNGVSTPSAPISITVDN